MRLLDIYDYPSTRDKVYEIVREYKILKLKLENIKPCFTKELKLVFTPVLGISDPTGDYSVWEIETKDDYEEKAVKIFRAFNKLDEEDRKIIKCLLLDNHCVKTSDEVMHELGYSKHIFKFIKKEAIIRFAIALNVEIEKTGSQKTSALSKIIG